MRRRRKHKPAAYQIWIAPQAHAQRRKLPGYVRQRIRRTIESLAHDPRPPNSRELDLTRLERQPKIPAGVTLRRFRLDRWRVVYAVDEAWQMITILTIRQRPPYEYDDLADLLAELK